MRGEYMEVLHRLARSCSGGLLSTTAFELSRYFILSTRLQFENEMISGVKRRISEMGTEPISILEKNIKITHNPDDQEDLMVRKLTPILKETQDLSLVRKLRLSLMKNPNSGLMGKKQNTKCIELSNRTLAERLTEDLVNKFTDIEPDNEKPESPKKIPGEPKKENAEDIYAGEPSDVEPKSEEPVEGEDNPNEPTSNSPTAAKIIEPPAPAPIPVEEISSDSDDPDGQDEDDDIQRPINPRRRRLLCTFFTFWGINAVLCLLLYSVAFRGLIRTVSEPNNPDYPLLLIPREKWSVYVEHKAVERTVFIARRVTVVQTDTGECHNSDECMDVLKNMERDGMLPYNFVISPIGDVFEVCGWTKASPMFTDMPTMVVAFMGNYDMKEPTITQLTQLKNLLSTSEHIEYLDSAYKITGRKIKILPTKLFQMLNIWKRYDDTNSDSEYVSIDYEPEVFDKD